MECDEQYVEYFSQNINNWCYSNGLQAEYDDMCTLKMCADIDNMMNVPISADRMAQKIIVENACHFELASDTPNVSFPPANFSKMTNEQDLEPSQRVIFLF